MMMPLLTMFFVFCICCYLVFNSNTTTLYFPVLVVFEMHNYYSCLMKPL